MVQKRQTEQGNLTIYHYKPRVSDGRIILAAKPVTKKEDISLDDAMDDVMFHRSYHKKHYAGFIFKKNS